MSEVNTGSVSCSSNIRLSTLLCLNYMYYSFSGKETGKKSRRGSDQVRSKRREKSIGRTETKEEKVWYDVWEKFNERGSMTKRETSV